MIESEYHLLVNIGNLTELTILEFARRINDLAGGKSKIVYQDRPVDDPLVRKPDMATATRLLGWEPLIDIKNGLMKTISWFKINDGISR